MGQQLHDSSPAARSVFHAVDEALNRPLSNLMFAGPSESLRETFNAQPAIMAVSLACITAMQEQLGREAMPKPAMMAGHSLGEYTALAVAGVLTIGETAWLVQERGRLMQEACDITPGGMAAILGLDRMIIEEISQETGTYVSNVNTPGQIVISGERIVLAQALDMAMARGARKAMPLSVGGAFHSGLMEPAREGLVQAVEKLVFKDPTVPIVANCTGKPLTKAEDVRKELIAQIANCVEWEISMNFMIESGISQFVEVGPGKALSGMIKRISRSAKISSVSDMDSILNLNKN